MAYTDHLLSYRQESSVDLEAEKVSLKAQRTIYTAQGMGTKTLQRDLRLLEERIQAINFVLRERGSTVITPAIVNHSVGIADFGSIR